MWWSRTIDYVKLISVPTLYQYVLSSPSALPNAMFYCDNLNLEGRYQSLLIATDRNYFLSSLDFFFPMSISNCCAHIFKFVPCTELVIEPDFHWLLNVRSLRGFYSSLWLSLDRGLWFGLVCLICTVDTKMYLMTVYCQIFISKVILRKTCPIVPFLEEPK